MTRFGSISLFALLVCAALLGACGEDRPAATTDAGNDSGLLPVDAGGEPDAHTPTDAGTTCPRLPAPADRTRHIVISHPYGASSMRGPRWEVLTLSETGEISRPGTFFEMAHTNSGEVVFTPDGKVGLVAQEDGSLGVFTLDDDGTPTVVHAAYEGGFYAGAVLMDPAGTHAWVLDQEWRESGGGIYRVDIGCDGSIEGESRVVEAKLPYGMVLRGDGTAVLAAKDALDSLDGDHAYLVSLDSPPSVLASSDAFGDGDWIGSSAALTSDGRFFLAGDNAAFTETPNRVAVVSVSDTALSPVQVISPVGDPVSIVTSPFDDAALVSSGFGDAVFVLDYSPAGATPFTLRGELDYHGGRPALPADAVLIRRGTLEGMVLLSENLSIRQMRFMGDGVVTDLGPYSLGSGTENIPGAIGVQP